MSYEYRNASQALPVLLHNVLHAGLETESRNGKTMERLMQHVTLTHPDLYITTPGRRVSLPAQIAETMWILAGRNDVEWLSHYLPRAAEFADDGKTWRGGYGPRLRAWQGSEDSWQHHDQLAHIVHLLKEDPETRRAVFTIYNPAIDNEPGKDIPCNNWVHFLPRDGVLHAHVAIRSNDLFWGWSGINAFEWTALLQVVAGLTGLKQGSITFAISSLHLYERHWDRAEAIIQQAREAAPRHFSPSPEFKFPAGTVDRLDIIVRRWFEVEDLIRKNSPAAMQQIISFPEPLLQSWLYALQAWNRGDLAIAGHYAGTALFAALEASPKRKVAQAVNEIEAHAKSKPAVLADRAKFTVFATKLHAEKNAAYGDSWKKRGEMLGIMANIARKVDRLGTAGGGDTAADTAIDLMMYLIKYNLWLRQQSGAQDAPTEGQSHVAAVDFYLQRLEKSAGGDQYTDGQLVEWLKHAFDHLEHLVEEKRVNRAEYVSTMIAHAYVLATRLWAKEEWHKANATRSFNGYVDPGAIHNFEQAFGNTKDAQ
jgi:thymidylate synthase